MSPWTRSTRYDVRALAIANRHYNRQTHDSPQFVPPGRNLVLYAPHLLWVTVHQRYVRHRWPGAWCCTCFRREVRRGHQASTLIRFAVAHTRYYLGEPPQQGMITFVNAAKVKPKANPGACFLHAGFEPDGETQGGLLAFVLRPENMPPPRTVRRRFVRSERRPMTRCPHCRRMFTTPQGLGLHFKHAKRNPKVCIARTARAGE